ncbi:MULTISPECIES: DUF1540 domain-containing protein [Romboutsia]|uniref:DUF1540 domain-containing protein n=1 Tax=Romboutsia hominis TaxID=1507512 RepID=A0A2P2BSS4_9FIRM|nr:MULTISPECIES: DUF1540 domain-containing protein [Romboutsia]CEI73396.1 Domain of Unknown Function (DUF1540) [Romboutsia hominis]
METNLLCLEKECAFNKSGSCYASHIKVEGYDAYITPETYCDTFRDSSSFSLSNYGGNISLTSTQNISCSADNCKYNISGGCSASFVQINPQNANCETFITK